MFYEAMDIPNPKKLRADIGRHGEAKLKALFYIALHVEPNKGVIDLDTIVKAHRFTIEFPNHHPVADGFTEEDIKFVWNYLIENKLLKAVITGH